MHLKDEAICTMTYSNSSYEHFSSAANGVRLTKREKKNVFIVRTNHAFAESKMAAH